jgi:hypothetical protein
MTKYLLYFILGFLAIWYAIAFSLIPGPFPFLEIISAILLGFSASLYLNSKNRSAAILSIPALLIFSPSILGNWKHLFNPVVQDNFFIEGILFVLLSNGILLTGLYITIRTLISEKPALFEFKKLNNFRHKIIIALLTIGAPLILIALSYWIYLKWK